MTSLLSPSRRGLLARLVLILAGSAAQAEPPNWKGSGTGTTDRVGPVDVDEFRGIASHMGKFVGTGAHILFPDFSFIGQETWTTANGDTLSVTFVGQLFFGTDPDFPFAFEAVLIAGGGTGRLANATGQAVMTGAFTGTFPGELYFEFEGTLHPNGK